MDKESLLHEPETKVLPGPNVELPCLNELKDSLAWINSWTLLPKCSPICRQYSELETLLLETSFSNSSTLIARTMSKV